MFGNARCGCFLCASLHTPARLELGGQDGESVAVLVDKGVALLHAQLCRLRLSLVHAYMARKWMIFMVVEMAPNDRSFSNSSRMYIEVSALPMASGLPLFSARLAGSTASLGQLILP